MSQTVSQPLSHDTARNRHARLCVVTAADIEFNAVAGLLAESSRISDGELKILSGRFADHEIVLLKSEVGAPGFAKRLAAHLAVTSYDALLVIGLAGGLDPQLKTGDAVIYDLCFRAQSEAKESNSKEKRLVREENASVVCDPDFSTRLFEKLRAAGLQCVRGAGLTIKRVVTEAENKLALGARYGAAAVDMETYDVIAACARAGLPVATLRVVLDEASDDLPDFNRALGADGSTNVWRLLPALLARPMITWRFIFNLRRAMHALRMAAGFALDVKNDLPQRAAKMSQNQCHQAVDKSVRGR